MKRITSILLTLFLIAAVFPSASFASGDKIYFVGDDIVVTINASSKTLTVSGNGPMPDYTTASYAPWYADPLSETVIVEHGITSVGDRCFSGNKYTKNVILGDSIERIGISAFSNNTALTNVELPGGLKRIESFAFYSDPMPFIFFTGEIEYIGPSAFEYCKSLTGFTLPDSLQYLDATAFLSTKYYNSLPYGINTLNGFTMKYKGASLPQTVDFPEDTRVISTNTLIDSSNVTAVNLPYGVEKILDRGIYNLKKLKSITVPDTVNEIGSFGIGYYLDSAYDTPLATAGFTIFGHGGMTSEAYANAWNFAFECQCEEGVYISYNDCLVGGEAIVGCKYCFKPLRTEYIEPATSHLFGDEIVTPAACTSDGSVKRECILCGITELIEYIPATGHVPSTDEPVIVQPTCTEKGEIYYLCSVCGEPCTDAIYIPPKGHVFGDAVITVEPTCTEEGAYERVCAVCGELAETGVIPPLGHTPNESWTVLNPSFNGSLGFRVRQCASCGIALEYESFIAGDINGDGKINGRDMNPLKKIIAGTLPDGTLPDNADLNYDGKVNGKDLTLMKKVIAGALQ